ncbi:MAG: hypothetical protein J6N76_03930 [Lachnospiraceae bacterium]|nr:hypothetical protein [Lachnospiraceae bacterium]
MKCAKCGNEFEGGLFCPKCGTKNVESATPKAQFCAKCGAPIKGGLFCHNCGASLAEDAIAKPISEGIEQATKSGGFSKIAGMLAGKKAVVALASVLAASVIGVTALGLNLSKNKDSTSETSLTTSQSEKNIEVGQKIKNGSKALKAFEKYYKDFYEENGNDYTLVNNDDTIVGLETADCAAQVLVDSDNELVMLIYDLKSVNAVENKVFGDIHIVRYDGHKAVESVSIPNFESYDKGVGVCAHVGAIVICGGHDYYVVEEDTYKTVDRDEYETLFLGANNLIEDTADLVDSSIDTTS